MRSGQKKKQTKNKNKQKKRWDTMGNEQTKEEGAASHNFEVVGRDQLEEVCYGSSVSARRALFFLRPPFFAGSLNTCVPTFLSWQFSSDSSTPTAT